MADTSGSPSITRALTGLVRQRTLSPVNGRGGWHTIFESFAGAWQTNVEVNADAVLAYHAVFSCITLIASDIGKLRAKLVERDANGIWRETDSAAFSPVLRKPNHYQNHVQFKEWWILSKLSRGNTYALKARDARGVVAALYLLDPATVTPLVSESGDVFYQLQADNLSGVPQSVVVPASEIIHDRFNCLFHPLVGLSPIYACGLAATQGLRIQNNSARFFGNMSRPSGILTAPGAISDDTATRLKASWEANYGGENIGKVAVLGDGLQYQPMSVTPEAAQLIEQLKWTAEVVCSTFHVPAFKIGVGQMPTYQNGEILNQIYYNDCLQSLIEAFEVCMDEGLGLTTPKEGGRVLGVELEVDDLWRMDTATQVKTLKEGVGGAIFSPDEARFRLNLPPKPGGSALYLQEQNYSLEALAKRDARPDPFAKDGGATPPAPDDAAAKAAEAQQAAQHAAQHAAAWQRSAIDLFRREIAA